MMIYGSILLLSAAVVVVILLSRLSIGRPGSFERFGLSGLAIVLIVGGTSMFAADFLSPKDNKPAANDPNGQGNGNEQQPVAELPPHSEPIAEQERASLHWLHRSTVEIFVDRPGFGMRRMVMPLHDVVNAPKLTSDSSSEGVQTGIPLAVPLIAKGPNSKRDSHFAFHDVVNRHWNGVASGPGEVWSVKSVQLVGLVKNPRPVVYDSARVPGMKDVKELATRPLDVFETHALDTLRGGDNLVANKSGKQMRVMAPIYAGARCTSCHEQKGQLLGAFSYVLQSGPPLKLADIPGPGLE